MIGKKQIRIILTDEFKNWVEDNVKDLRVNSNEKTCSLRWRIEHMINNDIKPPLFNSRTNEVQTNVSLKYTTLEKIRNLDGRSWAEKFDTYIGNDLKRRAIVESRQRAFYVPDPSYERLVELGNGNASQGLRILTSDRVITLSESQRDALMLLGGGSVEEGLKLLVGS